MSDGEEAGVHHQKQAGEAGPGHGGPTHRDQGQNSFIFLVSCTFYSLARIRIRLLNSDRHTDTIFTPTPIRQKNSAPDRSGCATLRVKEENMAKIIEGVVVWWLEWLVSLPLDRPARIRTSCSPQCGLRGGKSAR